METNWQLTRNFEMFAACPYWDRAWTTQEVLLARKLTMLVDGLECSSTLFTGVHLLRYWWKSTRRAFITYTEALCGHTKLLKDSLISLLDKLPGRECMVPRDQFDSLVFVVSDAATLPIDYGDLDNDVLFQLLCLVENSLCLCTLICIANILHFPKLSNGFRYKMPIFKLPLKLVKMDDPWQRECPMCEIFLRADDIGAMKDHVVERHFICIKQLCDGVAGGHIYMSKHQADSGIYYTTREISRYQTLTLDVAHVEVDTSVHGPPLLNIYIEATVLTSLFSGGWLGLCSKARMGNGILSFHQASFAENIESALSLRATKKEIGNATTIPCGPA
jgi:hypothetical protein